MTLIRYTAPDGALYYVTPDGLHVPSVTTILRPPGSHRNDAMDTGATRGSRLHACLDHYAAGTDHTPPPDALPFWERLRPWLDRNVTEWIAQERAVWSDLYAGTLDAVIRVREYGRVLVDVKSCSKPVRRKGAHTRWGPQVGAYVRLYEGDLDAAGVVVSYADQPPDVWIYTLDEIEQVTAERFDAALERWYDTHKVPESG